MCMQQTRAKRVGRSSVKYPVMAAMYEADHWECTQLGCPVEKITRLAIVDKGTHSGIWVSTEQTLPPTTKQGEYS